jgi:16S rRNA (cytidine1402-2'-O)-methyltransferase
VIILGATPIGNLGDASARLVAALEQATVIAAEDTRTTQRLLQALGIANRPRLVALHDHNEKQRAAELVARAREEDLLVLSDGHAHGQRPRVRSRRRGHRAGRRRHRAAGTQRRGHRARRRRVADRSLHLRRVPAAQGRSCARSRARGERAAHDGLLRSALASGRDPPRHGRAFGADRPAAVCRELTKLHEEVVRDGLAALAEWAQAGVRGEIVVVVGGAPAREVSAEDAVAQVQALVADGIRLKDASAEVAAATGLSSRDLYQAVLASR